MAKVIKGTGDSRRQARTVRKATGGTDKIRCPGCASLAISVPNGVGGRIHECVSCKKRFKFQTL